MQIQKYAVNQYLVENILSWINSGEIAIPEIQRPFVWDSTKVRDLMDSLYQGYPVGYIIAWKNPNIRLKDGSMSEGKKILIDGQQRITAMTAALLGHQVIDKEYKPIYIKIAFNPIEEKFEVQNPAILKDKTWLADISEVVKGNLFDISETYIKNNPEVNKAHIQNALSSLTKIPHKQIGMIELAPELDIETVTEIFIRINSKGVVLSQADFAMSKISADDTNNGKILRKLIDYFCHLAVAPEYYKHIIENDKEFANSEYMRKIAWLKDENEDLYDPNYSDLIRVAFTSKFDRGKLSDLVSLLSGRDFEKRTFEDVIRKKSYEKLFSGVEAFINKTNFQRFLIILKSAGFVVPELLRSQNATNFAYVVYLKLKDLNVNSNKIASYISKWLVYSILRGRYSNSPESLFDFDIKQISSKDMATIIDEREKSELSEVFWEVTLVESLDTSVASSPFFNVFLAAQVKADDYGFLSKDVKIRELVELKGDKHHLFPKDYLKKNGFQKSDYNQIANYVFMQSEINIKIGNSAPIDYFTKIKEEIKNGNISLTGINNEADLLKNLEENCIPYDIQNMTEKNYNEFLKMRRKLMAQKIKEYYFSL